MGEPLPSDEQLIAAFRESGVRPLLDDLVRRHVGRVHVMIYQMVLNDAYADDLTQEVFRRAIRGLPNFRGQARFSTWLTAIAMNTARSFLARQPRPPLASVDELADRADRRSPSPVEEAMANELDADIRAAIRSLPPSLRAAIVLTTMQGLSVREAARAEGCLAATLYWRIHKARKLLKKRLAEHLQ